MKITPLTYKEFQLFKRYQARVFNILKHGSKSYIQQNLKDFSYNELWYNRYKGTKNPVVVKFFNEKLKINNLNNKLIAFQEIKGIAPKIPQYEVDFEPENLFDSINFQLAIKGIPLTHFERNIGGKSLKEQLSYDNLEFLYSIKKTYMLNIGGFSE